MKRRVVYKRDHTPVFDTGTAERWQHSAARIVPVEGAYVAQAEVECVLDRWLMIGAITRGEHEAGLRLRADYITGGVALIALRRYDGVRGPTPGAAWQSPGERRSAAAESAYRRWRGALAALGSVLTPVALAVCCEDNPLSWAHRDQVRSALGILEKHYGLR